MSGRKGAGVLAAVLLIAFELRRAGAADSLPTAWRQGIATNYGGAQDGKDPYSPSFGTLDGSCGYGELDKSKWPYWSVGALSTSNMYYSEGPVNGCGECFEVQCLQNSGQFAGRCNQDSNARSVTIMITDSCPECEADHLDIQALTFNKMAPMALGRIDIQYRRVECTVPQDLNVIIDQNRGAGGWIRLQVKDAAGRGSVKLVQVKGSNSDWESMNNVWGASWESTSVPSPPLDFRIQDDAGVEVTAFSVVTANGETGTLPTGINFQFSSGSPGSAPSPSSSSSSSSGTPNTGSNPIPQPQITTAVLDDTTITTTIIGGFFLIRKGGPTSPTTAAATAATETVFWVKLYENITI
ncbi:probable Expansin-A7 [Coccomyxa sp. Obi]|nr:probable Expansin-A7 [Coccomyxa sp. Obi]